MSDVVAAINVIYKQFKEAENTEELFCCVKEVLPFEEDLFKVITVSGKLDRFMGSKL